MEIARSVYINTKGGSKSIIWTEIKQKPFETLEAALTSAPALELLVVFKPFHLFVQKNKRHYKRNFKPKPLSHGNFL